MICHNRYVTIRYDTVKSLSNVHNFAVHVQWESISYLIASSVYIHQ